VVNTATLSQKFAKVAVNAADLHRTITFLAKLQADFSKDTA